MSTAGRGGAFAGSPRGRRCAPSPTGARQVGALRRTTGDHEGRSDDTTGDDSGQGQTKLVTTFACRTTTRSERRTEATTARDERQQLTTTIDDMFDEQGIVFILPVGRMLLRKHRGRGGVWTDEHTCRGVIETIVVIPRMMSPRLQQGRSVGLALCPRRARGEDTLVGPGRTPTVHQGPCYGEAVGGPSKRRWAMVATSGLSRTTTR